MESRRKLAVVGIHTSFGRILIDQLDRDESVDSYLALDLMAPIKNSPKMRFVKVDLTEPGIDQTISEIFKTEKIEDVFHTFLKNNPSANPEAAHELDVIGTIHLIAASKAAQIKKFVFCSTTAVYGAKANHPNYISETQALDAHPPAHFIRDKVEADSQVQKLFADDKQVCVTTLRFALALGPRSNHYFTQIFQRAVVPTLLGFDPLMQFIHEHDVDRALALARTQDHPGIFNIVGKGVVPLSYALRQNQKSNLPVASWFAYPIIQSLWKLHLVAVPAPMLDYFKYPWVADGSKAKRVMNFEAAHTSKESFQLFIKENLSHDASTQ